MRLTLTLLTSAIFVWSPPSFATGATPVEACSEYSQAESRTCFENLVQASTVELAHEEKAAATAIARWDEDERYRAGAQAALRDESKSFSQFRKTHCALAEALGGGAIGNALMLRKLACVAEANRARAADLRRATASLPMR